MARILQALERSVRCGFESGAISTRGVRCLDDDVTPLARSLGFSRDAVVAMPANNLIVVFRR